MTEIRGNRSDHSFPSWRRIIVIWVNHRTPSWWLRPRRRTQHPILAEGGLSSHPSSTPGAELHCPRSPPIGSSYVERHVVGASNTFPHRRYIIGWTAHWKNSYQKMLDLSPPSTAIDLGQVKLSTVTVIEHRNWAIATNIKYIDGYDW